MNDETRSAAEQQQDQAEQKKEQQRYYFYAFSFEGRHINGRPASASVYMCYSKKIITYKKILSAKKEASVCNDAVLIAVSYLGYMTHEEFTHE